jgi:hypothetical protein
MAWKEYRVHAERNLHLAAFGERKRSIETTRTMAGAPTVQTRGLLRKMWLEKDIGKLES